MSGYVLNQVSSVDGPVSQTNWLTAGNKVYNQRVTSYSILSRIPAENPEFTNAEQSINSYILLDVLCGAQNGPAQSCRLIRCSVQVVEDHFLQVGLHFLHLSEDDPSLPLNLCLTQRAVLDDVSQDLHSLGERKQGTSF